MNRKKEHKLKRGKDSREKPNGLANVMDMKTIQGL